MRKLDKIITLSTEYEAWYKENKAAKYKSSTDKYYYDVLYELLIIQEGLCAYTEYRLIEEPLLDMIKAGYDSGKYTSAFRPQIPAHIEHFSKARKITSGWDWDNLFTTFTEVNFKKNHLEDKYGVDDILKPDTKKYDPNKYLMYDISEHLFFPNSKLNKPDTKKVFNMIIVLGLNNDFIRMKRREYLETIKILDGYSKMKQTIHQFHTAYSMM